MTIDEIPVKSDKIAITDKLHQLSAEEFNTLVDMVRQLRDEVFTQTGASYRVYLTNNLNSLTIAAQKGVPTNIDFTLVSQVRETIDAGYINTNEYGSFTLSVQNNKYQEYTVVRTFTAQSAISILIDVQEYLTAGLNYVRVQAKGLASDVQTSPLTYTVNLMDMGATISDAFEWWKAKKENFYVPMFISGNNSKILWVKVTGDNGYSWNNSYNIGTSSYTDNAYNCLIEHPKQSGVYTIEYYMSDAEGILFTSSKFIEIICINEGDTGTYVAINNVISKATNWIENRMFDYAIYDGSLYYSKIIYEILRDVVTEYESTEDNVQTEIKHTFNYSMEIETEVQGDFDIVIKIKDDSEAVLRTLAVPVDNSLSYGSVPGAVFYMNPKTRSNNQLNYKKVTNVVDGSEIDVIWTGMNWGNDGWTTDDLGNRVLRLFGGSSAVIDYKPFYVRTGYEQDVALTGKTIEIDFLIKNITNYDNTTADMSKTTTVAGVDSFIGLKVFPEQVIMWTTVTKGTTTDEEGNVTFGGQQRINICENQRIRLTLTVVPNAYNNKNFNLCIIYVNGVKNREFVYPSNDIIGHDSPITIGSDYADIDVYGIRVYNSGLSATAVQQNYINWLSTADEKKTASTRADVFAEDGLNVSFEKVVNLTDKANADKFNCFVMEMNDGADIPSKDNQAEDLKCTLDVYYAEHPDWNFTVQNAPVGGQGTSSMKYRKWNLRWKFKNSTMIYADGSETTTGKTVRFTKDESKPTYSSRLTAKKNFASSMHSHKMGSVNSFGDLWKELGFVNQVNARISVYQYPFIGFQKVVADDGTTTYKFIGLYTLGPDKGDDLCFGYDTDKYPNLLSIEGSDNDPLFALFRVPWNPNKEYMKYNSTKDLAEAYQYNGTNSWDYDAGDPASDEKDDEPKVEALYKLQWLPAYNFAYSCSDRIKPFEGTAEELNANKVAYKNEPYEFWVTGGDVYYYEKAEDKFIPSDVGNGTINLYTQLVDKGYGLVSSDVEGKLAEELNELFKKARIQKFKQEMEYYFDKRDAIFHRNWVEFNAATDNRAKNTYPYIFDVINTTTKEGYKWRWRGDDMDTIWPITNQGQSKKGYSVETHDVYEDGGPVWNGATSVFWNLIDAAFEEDIKDEMTKFMKAMEKLSGMTTEGTAHDRIYAFFDKYYFKQAQEYFSMSLYNADAKWTYEDAKWAYMNKQYSNDTDPITQSLGDHYSAEKRWISKRIVYMMSKYSYGMFSSGGQDVISVRSAGGEHGGTELTFNLTPAMDLYPTIATGTTIIPGKRTKAGEVYTTSFISTSGDQQYDILGAHYYRDIGDWYDKLTNGEMLVNGRMLRELRIGNEDSSKVKIAINKLNIGDCESLQKIDVRNISTLSSELTLTECTHLREIYAKGTSVSKIELPNGGALQYIQYGDTTTHLSLKNFPLLNAEGVDISGCVDDLIFFHVEQCDNLDPLKLLADVMENQESQGDKHKLQYVRATGFNVTYDDSDILDKAATLLNGTYFGLDSEGNPGSNPIPVLQGIINVNSYAYEDTITELEEAYGKENLKINALGYAVRFQDPLLLEMLCSVKLYDNTKPWGQHENYVDLNQDGYITKEEIESVVNFRMYMSDRFPAKLISSWQDPQPLKRFNELRLFTNLRTDSNSYGIPAFTGFSDFCEFTLPTGLSDMVISGNTINATTVAKCIIPEGFVKKIDNPFECAFLQLLDLPSTMTTIQGNTFARFAANLTVVCRAIVPPETTCSFWNFSPIAIYVPDESVEAYKTASTWKSYANIILPLSQKPLYGIYGIGIVTNDGAVLTADFGADYPYEKGVKWTIEEGEEYATVDEFGEVKPKPGVWCKDIVVRGTSKFDSSVTAVKKCIVYDTHFEGKWKLLGHHYGIALDTSTGGTKQLGQQSVAAITYVEVVPGAKVKLKNAQATTFSNDFCFYDDSYNYVGYFSIHHSQKGEIDKTIPENAKYVRFNVYPTYPDFYRFAIWYEDTGEYIYKTPDYIYE